MSLKGVMLAAGRGTRLGPLTVNLPKPLLPVANAPVMARGLACLRRLGIADVSVNVSYRAAQIQDAFGDGVGHGVRLHWSVEAEPTGTAGGLKGMARYLAGSPLLLIAGDAMLEADLTPLLAAHRASGAFASLGTLAVDDPSQYGVVQTEADGRIIRFQEKPDPGAEISRQANTGIYIFEPGILDMIPTNTFHDFALHVFPEIMRRGLPFFAFPVQGYWTDVGNPRDYLQANLDYLDGRIGDPPVENLIAPDAEVRYAQLSRCVVGAGAVLPAGTSLRDSVVWPGTVLDAPLDATAAILTPWGHYRVDGAEARDLSLAAPLRAVG